MATVTATTTLSRSAIMQKAWKLYRSTMFGRSRFDRATLSWALKTVWAEVKKAAAIAARPLVEKLARKAEIEQELALLPYQSFRYDIGHRMGLLRDELRALAV